MLDLRTLQNDPAIVAASLKKRGSDIDVAEFTHVDAKRRALLSEVEQLKSERNKISSDVGQAKRAGKDASALLASVGDLGERIKTLDVETERVKASLTDWMLRIPNMPDESVPVGPDEEHNVVVNKWGTPGDFDFPAKEHWELAEMHGNVLDFERAGKLAGSRFTVYWRWAARLERAIANFFLDVHTNENGYLEILPPFMVNRKTMTGTGNLPKFEEDLFKIEGWDYFLIPTAEVPITNLFAEEVLNESDLPIAFTAYTPCFRSEAGSAGKDTRGLIRQHQFNKVEMVRFAHPDKSYDEHELMRRHAENLLERLELPYRTVVLCTGDMGFASAKTYDLEVWLPGQNKYREISSCSNCEAFQARRANIRFRPEGGGKPEFVHTLNGSGLAVGRTLVAVLENGQQKDGSIVLPKALTPYMGGIECIEPK